MSDDLNMPNLPNLPGINDIELPPIVVEGPGHSLPLPGDVSPPVVVEEPGDDGAPLPEIDGRDWNLGPGTVYPTVVGGGAAGGGVAGGAVIVLKREATGAIRRKTNCPTDWITITCKQGTLAEVHIYNGPGEPVKTWTNVTPRSDPVTHRGCFTHWYAGENATDQYAVTGVMYGIALPNALS